MQEFVQLAGDRGPSGRLAHNSHITIPYCVQALGKLKEVFEALTGRYESPKTDWKADVYKY